MSAGEQMQSQWLRHRTVLQEILVHVPDDKFDYQPWPNAMSLADLAVHMAAIADMFVQAVGEGQFGAPPAKPESGSAASVRQFVDDMTAKSSNTLAALTDEQLERVIEGKRFGADLPGKVWLHTMRDHEIHHKGQMFVYARMVGVEELPFFVNTKM